MNYKGVALSACFGFLYLAYRGKRLQSLFSFLLSFPPCVVMMGGAPFSLAGLLLIPYFSHAIWAGGRLDPKPSILWPDPVADDKGKDDKTPDSSDRIYLFLAIAVAIVILGGVVLTLTIIV